MKRDDFIQQLEDLTGLEVKDIQWIYGLGEQCNDGDEPIYYFDVCLQVRHCNGSQGFISLEADTYCEDINDCIGTMLGAFEECNSNLGDIPSRIDIDDVVGLLREYLYTYADTKDKPFMDTVYFERV